MYKVLAIDGGGIRGLIPALLLAEMEKRINKSIAEAFDLICGTSAGGIIACGLVRPDRNGGPVSAADLVSLFANRGDEIFERSFWQGVFSLGGNVDERYSADNLEAILNQILDDARLSEARKPLLVTSYDIEQRKPYFFKSTRAVASEPGREHLLRHIARATSAAPTYFEPALIVSQDDAAVRRALIDGGVFANNPAMCGYAEARAMENAPDEILLAAMGAGFVTRPIPYDEAKDWGNLGWVKPIIDVMFDAATSTVDYQLKQLLPDQAGAKRYFRFDTELDKALDDLDAANRANIDALHREANDILAHDTMGPDFEALCQML